MAGNDAADVTHGGVDNSPSLLQAQPERLGRRNRLKLSTPRCNRPLNAKPSDWRAENVLFGFGGRLEHDRAAIALYGDGKHNACTLADDALHIGEVADGLPGNRNHQVAWLETRDRGWAIRDHRIDPRAHGLRRLCRLAGQ